LWPLFLCWENLASGINIFVFSRFRIKLVWNKEVSFTPLFQTPLCSQELVMLFSPIYSLSWESTQNGGQAGSNKKYFEPLQFAQNYWAEFKFLTCQKVSSFRIFPGCPECLGVNEKFFNLSKVPKIIGVHLILGTLERLKKFVGFLLKIWMLGKLIWSCFNIIIFLGCHLPLLQHKVSYHYEM
jgi:hypothetical protein